MEQFLATLGLKLQILVAGAVGAFISLRFFEGLNTPERWFTFMGGWGLAAYTTSFLHEYLGLKSGASETGIALLIGLFGMSIVAAIIKIIRDTNWIAIVKRKTGGDDGGAK